MVGVFDSGLGGLVVVREMWKKNPKAGVVYVGDTAHVPFGDKSAEEIKRYAGAMVGWLRQQGVSQIVCACNTSWAVARKELGSVISVTEAGKKAAAGHKAGVLATTRTVESGVYGMPGQAVPGLVPLVESGIWDGLEVEEELEGPIKKLGNVDTVVLGCTHFPLVRGTIEKMMPGVRVIDPGEELAKELSVEVGPSRFAVTEMKKEYPFLAEKILGRKVEFELIKL